MGNKCSESSVFDGILRIFGVQLASKASCLQKKMNFFNLCLVSNRLLCYTGFFGGEYSSISQEYPPNKLRMRDTIYVAYKQAKEKYK